jgi:hypothetical protein
MPDSHSFAPAFDDRRGDPRQVNPTRHRAIGRVVDVELDDDEFDPAAHTIGEVKEYVEAHPDYATEIMEAEQDGKDRVTLVEWLGNFGES